MENDEKENKRMLNLVNVQAYVDPATLTYVIQIVAGVFIAGGVAIGVYWRKIKKLFVKDKTVVKHNASSNADRSAAAAAAEDSEA